MVRTGARATEPQPSAPVHYYNSASTGGTNPHLCFDGCGGPFPVSVFWGQQRQSSAAFKLVITNDSKVKRRLCVHRLSCSPQITSNHLFDDLFSPVSRPHGDSPRACEPKAAGVSWCRAPQVTRKFEPPGSTPPTQGHALSRSWDVGATLFVCSSQPPLTAYPWDPKAATQYRVESSPSSMGNPMLIR